MRLVIVTDESARFEQFVRLDGNAKIETATESLDELHVSSDLFRFDLGCSASPCECRVESSGLLDCCSG